MEKIPENPKPNESLSSLVNEVIPIAKRNRREMDGHHKKKHDAVKVASRHKHNSHHKSLAKPLSIQEPPTQDTWTGLKNHPLFLPVTFTIVALVLLVAFIISAKILYESERKARMIRERIKVEKATSGMRQVPKNVSKIDDPSVTIDVGR
jgi:hypothetical protein